ncbi:MAG: hypothetical protein ACLQVI_36815 [Polyangiaceae bacterium]
MGRKKFTSRLVGATLVIVATSIGSASCSSTPPPFGIAAQISPNAMPLSNAVASQAIVEQDQLIFPQAGNSALVTLQPGQILTSGVGDGFLRKVVNVASTGTSITVQTQPASLTDVVVDGETSATVGFASTEDDAGTEDDDAAEDDASPTGELRLHAVHRPRDIALPGFSKQLDGMVIYSKPALGVTIRIVKGSLMLNPSLYLDIKVLSTQPSITATLSGQLAADLHVEADCTASFPQQTFETDLWPSSPTIKVNLPPIGDVIPVVASVRLVILGGVQVSCGDATRLTAGGTASLTVSYGVQWSGNGIAQQPDPPAPTWTVDGPTMAAQVDLSALAYVSGGVQIGLFGGFDSSRVKLGAGGYLWVTIDPYLRFNYSSSDASSWALLAGLRGRYWGSLRVLSPFCDDSFPSAPQTFFDVNTQIAPADDASSGSPPSSPGTCSDGITNELETDVDCGGPDGKGGCPPCATAGECCVTDADCKSGQCVNGSCAPTVPSTCTGTDCGGSCLACVGSACSVGFDCLSGSCQPDENSSTGALVCALPPFCSDGVQDDDETDVDCGGPCAPTQACSQGQGCAVAADCTSQACTDGTCTALPTDCYPTCGSGNDVTSEDGGTEVEDSGVEEDDASTDEDAGETHDDAGTEDDAGDDAP